MSTKPTRRATSPPRFMTLAQLLSELGDDNGPLPRSTFHDWRAKGRAPKATKLPNGQLRFSRANVDQWLAALEEVSA